MKLSSYPKCLLCKENIGYRGRLFTTLQLLSQEKEVITSK